jgi:hypothetical protein
VCGRAGLPVASGSKGSLSMTHSASAVLVAAALSASVVVPAFGQTPTQTTETSPTQTTTTPTQTTTTPAQTTTPTETTPAPESPEPTSAPNEYVESIPTGGGQAPATDQRAAPAPATPANPSGTTSAETPTAPRPKKKAHGKKHTGAHQRRHRHQAEAPAPAAPALPSTPAAAEAGEPADPLLLGLALLAITVGVLSTAVARRQGVGT